MAEGSAVLARLEVIERTGPESSRPPEVRSRATASKKVKQLRSDRERVLRRGDGHEPVRRGVQPTAKAVHRVGPRRAYDVISPRMPAAQTKPWGETSATAM